MNQQTGTAQRDVVGYIPEKHVDAGLNKLLLDGFPRLHEHDNFSLGERLYGYRRAGVQQRPGTTQRGRSDHVVDARSLTMSGGLVTRRLGEDRRRTATERSRRKQPRETTHLASDLIQLSLLGQTNTSA